MSRNRQVFMHENTLKFVVLCIVSWHQSTGLAALESLPDISMESGRGRSPKVAILCDCSIQQQEPTIAVHRVQSHREMITVWSTTLT